MRILGLDVGEKRIGVAVSDPLGITAQPVSTIHRKTLKEDLETVQGFIDQFQVKVLVVGLPVQLSGQVGTKAREVFDFVKRLQTKVRIPIRMQDERLTTAQASVVLREGDVSPARQRKVIDQLAAQLILQSYLAQHRLT